MTLPDFNSLFDSKVLVSLFSVVGGGFIGNLIAVLRNRIKTLEYTVNHDRVAISADDAIFGSIRVTWQNTNVTNLFSSRVTLENQTSKDFVSLKIKVYTGDTLLLSERTEIPDTSYIVEWTDEFKQQIQVPQGGTPTEKQFRIFYHSREYMVPVFNRGHRIILTYLTTVQNGINGPSVWLDILHEGVQVQFRQTVPQVHGVPIRLALSVGLITCLVVLVLCGLLISEAWMAAVISMIVGLFAQSFGAFIYRVFRLLRALVVR